MLTGQRASAGVAGAKDEAAMVMARLRRHVRGRVGHRGVLHPELARGKARMFLEGGGEVAVAREAGCHGDRRDVLGRIGKQPADAAQPLRGHVLRRCRPERLAERDQQVVRAQAGERGERIQRYPFSEMRVDVPPKQPRGRRGRIGPEDP
jgi:hypothetical protein